MSEIDYEPDNESIIASCCKIIDAETVGARLKKRKHETRIAIEDIKELAKLERDYLLDD